MSFGRPALDDSRGLQLAVTVNPAHADKLLAGSGHTFARDPRCGRRRQAAAAFRDPGQAQGDGRRQANRRRVAERRGRAAGNDPKLKDEYVVFTAHLDHLGIGKPINGDSIYNGAMDNASGVAAMLDVAAMLKESGTKLRRSVLFVAVTGEEKGLLGSRYFANSPTVDPGRSSPTSTPTCFCRSFRSRS